MRLFIATPLPKHIEELLAKIIYDLKQTRTRVKWVTSKNIHLTLKFLGDTEEGKVNSIIEAIDRVAEKHTAVNCLIDKIGGFPNMKHPRVIWAGLSGDIDKIKKIASEIEEKMTAFGFEKERRPFKSHLTLGRVKESSGLSELTAVVENYQLAPEEVRLDKVVLFKSTLTPGGPIYERLHKAELRG